jgi:hypothetical protein
MAEQDEPEVYGYPVEILSVVPGLSSDLPVAMLTLRLDPDGFLHAITLMFSQEQAVFLRNMLDQFLGDERSWLYLPEENQRELCLQEEDDIPF